MQRASISFAKNNLSALIAQVKAGQTILITDRDRPVARLQPIEAANSVEDERLACLEREGLIKRGSGKIPPSFFKRKLFKSPDGASVLDALIEERRTGR